MKCVANVAWPGLKRRPMPLARSAATPWSVDYIGRVTIVVASRRDRCGPVGRNAERDMREAGKPICSPVPQRAQTALTRSK
ncbi:MAG TPA: hypothetical protein VNO18_06745 [Xanthobacteraceae bacterium]|nr:hypothetical protein [Xanthobacteraceae bacterium]